MDGEIKQVEVKWREEKRQSPCKRTNTHSQGSKSSTEAVASLTCLSWTQLTTITSHNSVAPPKAAPVTQEKANIYLSQFTCPRHRELMLSVYRASWEPWSRRRHHQRLHRRPNRKLPSTHCKTRHRYTYDNNFRFFFFKLSGQWIRCSLTTITICGDVCPLSCVSAEAYKLAQCTKEDVTILHLFLYLLYVCVLYFMPPPLG